MNLAIDFGNTRIKAGLFDASQLLSAHYFGSVEELLGSLSRFTEADNCVIGSVTRDHEAVIGLLPTKMPVLLFAPGTRTPLVNRYESAMTLGSDRLAAAVGAHALYPDADVLTVDAGTCIKYNFVNRQNEYLGGGISPGIRMRLSSMHADTSALPEVQAEAGYSRLTGSNTRESLLTGAQLGAVCEVDGMIGRYLDEYPQLIVALTGGDAAYLAPRLKSRFFAHENLVLRGLNEILRLNLPH